MGESLDKFNEIRDMLERSDNQLKILRDKFVQLQLEHARKVVVGFYFHLPRSFQI